MDFKSTLTKYFNKETALLATAVLGLSVGVAGSFYKGDYLTGIVVGSVLPFAARLWKHIADGKLNSPSP